MKRMLITIPFLLCLVSQSFGFNFFSTVGGKRTVISIDGTWQGDYAAGTTYAAGDIVASSGINYKSLQSSNTGNTPASSPTYWQAILAKGDTGATGDAGASSYTYVAYASDASGTDFTTTFDADLNYVAIKVSATEIETPAASDFTGLWKNYRGATGATGAAGADGNGITAGSDGTYGWYTGNNTSEFSSCTSGRYGIAFVGGVPQKCVNGTLTSLYAIPNSDDPDVAAAGQISFDSDGWLRVYNNSRQEALARTQEEIHVTVVKPQDMADAVRDGFLVWSNESGMTFTVTGWKAWSGTDDTTLNIETTAANGQTNATVDAVEIATNGTGVYTAADTTITAATIANGSLIWLDFDDTDDPAYVKLVIYGYYSADVN